MAKLTTTDLTSLANETSAVNTLNANFALVETAMDNTVSRDGTATNTMLADFDMNGNDILNVGAITFGSSGTSVEDSLISTPTVTVDNSIVRWNGIDGTAIDDTTAWTISDADIMTAGGNLDMSSNNITGVINLTLTGGGTFDANGSVVTEMKIKDTSEATYDNGNLTGNVTFDFTNGHYQYGTLTGNATVTSVTNWPASGDAGSLVVEVTQSSGGSNTIAFTGVEWAGASAPTLTATANAVDVYTLVTRDAGTTVRGFISGQDMS